MKKILLVLAFTCLLFAGCSNKDTLNISRESKDLNTYTMELEYNDDHTLVGSQKLEYRNNTDTSLNKVSFHLYPRAFSEGAVNKPVSSLNMDKAYPNGVDYGDITINEVKVGGEVASLEYSGTDLDILNVGLKSELDPMDKVIIEIDYKVYIPNINHRFGYGDNTINLANFYPVVAVYENGQFVVDSYNSNGDPFYSDCSNYNVKITVPNNLQLASTGTQDKIENVDDKKVYSINALCVRDFAMVLSEKFEIISDKVGDTTVMYYYYDDDNYIANFKAGVDAVNTFNDLFGTYPYSTLSVVKTNFVHGGMEYPNLVYISDETEGADYINVIIHETAHQWWYGVVGSNAFEYGWLDEGLTEYSTALFYENNPDYGVDVDELIKNTNNSYVTFIELYTDILGKVDTSMTRALDEYDTEPEYVYMTYVKGMLMFDDIRNLVGTTKFLNGLKLYYKTYALKNVTPDDFIAIMEKSTKRELRSYINTWLDGKVVIIAMN